MQIDDIVNKEFNRAFVGYDMREVDSFLDDIIDRLERYEAERREMLTAMGYLLDKLENGGSLPDVKRSKSSTKETPRKRARGPRKMQDASRQSLPDSADEKAEMKLTDDTAPIRETSPSDHVLDDMPNVDELFPEILDILTDMDISNDDEAPKADPEVENTT